MSEIQRNESTRRMSRTVVHNGVVYLAGITSAIRGGDIVVQTKSVLATIDACLASVGSSKERILSAQIWLKDLRADLIRMNDVWDTWIPAGFGPARATCEARLAAPELLIEVIVTAAV
ncbi:Enamine deaminase RidA, house cleaning of reactive enamine intermediates, YjgF/YER057c/UK114 family [Variovorax sp. YR750]|uniref:RidA family protein n=1 Tax=Variovorax sp. YR750 TaxID=1884384 RepID=UPI0008D28AC2|nr:RidA family protein [Variovorax sp. YR750]SEM04932.1 Enamine deaminase RidA, house cleaning of reactive enamine intermediates, YjgF/YER057c/UK114 family [Variovorax sp. YR750]